MTPRDLPFRSPYRHGFARVAAVTVPVALADPARNAATVIEALRSLADEAVAVAVFPELGLTGYAIDDLRLQTAVLDAAEAALRAIADATRDAMPLVLVGAPLRHRDHLFNAAVAIHRGALLGAVPKSHLPNYREFYEGRHFAPGAGIAGETIRIGDAAVPFGTDLMFEASDLPDLRVAAEICEDVWVPVPPSSLASLAGATVLANLSASNITVGKADERALLCRSQSARCIAAYVYAAAGAGESSTDLAWDGQVAVFENGEALAETGRFPAGVAAAIADVDLARLAHERMATGSRDTNARLHAQPFRRVGFTVAPPATTLALRRPVSRFPFVPSDPVLLERDCFEAYSIQVSALAQRLASAGVGRVVIGVSGGLDSTQALLVAADAFDRLGRGRADILAYTMPGFGTSDGTRGNALALMEALGVTASTLDIRPAANRMLADIDHPFSRGEKLFDVTFENVQAGLRTDFLFRLANRHDALVLGTGDLSELALGWCTYGVGDQMSHYNVNAGLPKTLIQHLIRWVIASGRFGADVAETLRAILATEISPELVPPGEGGVLQSTEEKIGPYALQDFTLFHVLRHGDVPSRIAFLAITAWEDVSRGAWPPNFPPELRRAYTPAEVRHWLAVFLRRFFAFSQFKRSAMPNGPKMLSGGALSPRGDWRAPSDGNAAAWLAELEANVPPDA